MNSFDAPTPPRRRGISAAFGDRSIRTKLLGLVAVTTLVTFLLGGLALQSVSALRSTMNNLVQDQASLNVSLAAVKDGVWNMRNRASMLGSYIGGDVTDQVAALNEATTQLDDAVTELADGFHASAGRDSQNLTDFATSLAAYRDLLTNGMIPAAQAGDNAAYAKVDEEITPIGGTVVATLSSTNDEIIEHLQGLANDADQAAQRQMLAIAVAILVGTGLALAFGLALARLVRGPISKVQRSLEAMAEGDLTLGADVGTADELGQMARALGRAQSALRETIASVVATSDTVASAAEELSSSTSQITATSEETSVQAGSVASAADQVSQRIQTVAVGAEQMGASIREISQSTSDAARVAGKASDVALATNDTVSKLGASSQEIGNVIKVITSISEQTNLLALNATIEAARAGAAGKGFAVVASEVKELAQESAKAADDIARRIEAIQADATGAVGAIDEITEIIGRINDFQTTIASAVEEQTATTSEMARNVNEAATGSGEIAANITGVASAAQVTSGVVAQVGDAVHELARMAADLRAQAARFVY